MNEWYDAGNRKKQILEKTTKKQVFPFHYYSIRSKINTNYRKWVKTNSTNSKNGPFYHTISVFSST